MWRRVVSSSSAQLQTLASPPCRSSRPFLIYSSSSSAMAPFQGSFTLSSFHTSFASSSSSAFATNHEHDEVESEFEGRNTTSRQSATYSGYYGQNNQQWQQNPNVVYADSSRAPQQSSNQFSQNYSGGFKGSTGNEFVNNPVQQSGNFSGYHGHENGRFQQTTQQNWKQLGNGSMQQNSYMARQERPREVGQIPDGFNSQINSGSQGSISRSSMHNSAEYQQNTISYNRGISSAQKQQNLSDYYKDNGQYQQSVGYGQYQSSSHVGEYQQTPNVGQYQQTPQVGQYQQSPQAGQPAEASESNPNSVKGTLEELDLFCKEGKVKEAVEVLDLLERQHLHVNLDRYLQLMHACGEAIALEEATSVHEKMRLLFPLEVSTYNRILEMYSKCGSMENALMVFNDMPKRNMTSWDIMITWLARNGHGEDAIDLFTQFKKAGLKPDSQMFIGVFHACSVVGDADEGLLHFESMSKDYGIVPTMDHYVSVVDMLGSIGLLDEALEFIEKMPLEPNVDVWKTLMHFCRVHGYLELGDRCAELVDQLDPSCLNEQSKAGLVPVNESDLVKEKEKKQLAAKNLLEIRSRVHEYRAGDRSHPDNEKFYTLLRGLREQMKEAGYIPETRFVLHDIDQEGKEDALLSHSERLAVADGLLASSARSPIRVIKNLRVCGDCHSALKIISKIVGRELIMRDAKRFHHLKDGKCSCNDYW
ncbi:pentatricopeptide repeat-containing protein At4g32450, mitochondrial [Rosa rugosa]|uniref:pentatricopeptide repeat-containing protein At4g32450, mitochondrial n=1 Tax=Rosa rugosa TaxID=74645 RepID=UPI002B405A70|nr:pentatricopeptide repeat-containing protein At4g32450, mitochondrial [Rosa rugosa]